MEQVSGNKGGDVMNWGAAGVVGWLWAPPSPCPQATAAETPSKRSEMGLPTLAAQALTGHQERCPGSGGNRTWGGVRSGALSPTQVPATDFSLPHSGLRKIMALYFSKSNSMSPLNTVTGSCVSHHGGGVGGPLGLYSKLFSTEMLLAGAWGSLRPGGPRLQG